VSQPPPVRPLAFEPHGWPMRCDELLEAIQSHHQALKQAHESLVAAELDVDFHLTVIREYERELIRLSARRAVG
jgi:hypothetical protein